MGAKTGSTWRLIDPGHLRAHENMAWDAALLEVMSQTEGEPLFRFEEFRPRAVLVGFHQDVEQEVNLAYCRQHGLEVNRRLTGGGAIYEDESQVGWELVAKRDDPALPWDRRALFEVCCRAVAAGLKELGVEARFRPKNDIEVGGRKISGTGGTDLGDALLFHGSLLVDLDVETMVRSLKIPAEKLKDKAVSSTKERVTCLAWELGEIPPRPVIKQAILNGFRKILGIQFVPGDFSAQEKACYRKLAPYYASADWVYQIRKKTATSMVTAMRKTPGGLINLAVSVNVPAKRIKQALITGDFFCIPPRAILDLESRLKDLPYEQETISEVIQEFFRKAEIPGVTPEDFLHLFQEAKKFFSGKGETASGG
ncbi:MAG: lipoate--protein ligase family protein [Firmicutes bacterium]|nr:lipoate--protein ligase family protein [Bacillota bacterium]